MVAEHKHRNADDPKDFIRILVEWERVHIVTLRENYDVAKVQGDYAIAGITLVEWIEVPVGVRVVLWQKMLRSRVANAATFREK